MHFRPKIVNDPEFANECFRCARCIEKSEEHIWRWTAFHFGLDLVVTLNPSLLKFRRYHKTDSGQIKANHDRHNIILRYVIILN